MPIDARPRCDWALGSEAECAYHDAEWGVPVHGDDALFELLTLEGAQAGLSWRTVLIRRDAYRAAFHGFRIAQVAAMTDDALAACLENPGLIRHRQKIASVRTNARAALALGEGGLDRLLWGFVDGVPVVNAPASRAEVPAETPASRAMSKALRKAGFSFVGSTICYALMQAGGMVNDHLTGCFRYPAARKA
ncbi:MAG: DNA-3-methyladenine glycosylase I [Rhodospirillales bacterium]|nr:DNA-3-methyladenine glycosylase I [Rhodospirillales bacterium]